MGTQLKADQPRRAGKEVPGGSCSRPRGAVWMVTGGKRALRRKLGPRRSQFHAGMTGSVGKIEARINNIRRRKGNEEEKPRKAKGTVQMRSTPIDRM